ncbi:MAG: hypothetical protein ABIA74_00985 [bacterium]
MNWFQFKSLKFLILSMCLFCVFNTSVYSMGWLWREKTEEEKQEQKKYEWETRNRAKIKEWLEKQIKKNKEKNENSIDLSSLLKTKVRKKFKEWVFKELVGLINKGCINILDLSDNQLEDIDELALIDKDILKGLNLSDNPNIEDEAIEKIVKNNQNLEWLSLQNVGLTTIPESLTELRKLKILSLIDNQNLKKYKDINEKIEKIIENNPNFEQLFLDNIGLTKMPENIRLENLNFLSLSKNKISNIYDVLEKVVKNKFVGLWLRDVGLKKIPHSILYRFEDLKYLDLSYNKIENITVRGDYGKCPLDYIVKNSPSLEYLNLNNANLTDVSVDQFAIANLIYDPISDRSRANSTYITFLDLSNNKIQKIEEVVNSLVFFCDLLKTLNLKNVGLKDIPKNIISTDRLDHLKHLDLSDNPFDALLNQKDLKEQEGVLNGLIKLQKRCEIKGDVIGKLKAKIEERKEEVKRKREEKERLKREEEERQLEEEEERKRKEEEERLEREEEERLRKEEKERLKREEEERLRKEEEEERKKREEAEAEIKQKEEEERKKREEEERQKREEKERLKREEEERRKKEEEKLKREEEEKADENKLQIEEKKRTITLSGEKIVLMENDIENIAEKKTETQQETLNAQKKHIEVQISRGNFTIAKARLKSYLNASGLDKKIWENLLEKVNTKDDIEAVIRFVEEKRLQK